ncbi:hypothetical protein C8R47DRAFT_1242837 [Mycena vitilis]|nr:hypothetical protein C8R47DRAFT_1242837 [Mycena vitilis]
MLRPGIRVTVYPSALTFAFSPVALTGMYCLNGNGTTPANDSWNTDETVNPLYKMTKKDWWFHHYDACDEFPPAEGVFLELPANGEFTVELATNRAFTSLSYDGTQARTLDLLRYLSTLLTRSLTGTFPGGQDHINYTEFRKGVDCITSPNLHTKSESMAAGTAFAISYESDISQVTPENLVVFSILYHTPWKRVVNYPVPNLPACPPDGCICAWGWVPNGCGEPNMYMHGLRCKVTGEPGTTALASAVPPNWCEDSPANCTTGARQMIYWNQLDGNNIVVSGNDLSGSPKSPAYNSVLGFHEGAQHDIFVTKTRRGVPNNAQAQNMFLPHWSAGRVCLLLFALGMVCTL